MKHFVMAVMAIIAVSMAVMLVGASDVSVYLHSALRPARDLVLAKEPTFQS